MLSMDTGKCGDVPTKYAFPYYPFCAVQELECIVVGLVATN